ncbi:uncharacterized protein PV07_07030 [Cladophialophora immunda]|uniref:Pentatricopeptide repeat protein n=1 Tax=Cladophialophora immunda TaxID=569365 RepID=A0A0D1ZH49_9EURO|nr:uncharacterized protein PV07_07030 [Cladophialophora immunda]KIW27276.1 hypothetical protein PV07_07030 [Cladophialophora immunda]OQV05874.1 pentatricopeptide repeat-containing protein [Cladophialophora immunda]
MFHKSTSTLRGCFSNSPATYHRCRSRFKRPSLDFVGHGLSGWESLHQASVLAKTSTELPEGSHASSDESSARFGGPDSPLQESPESIPFSNKIPLPPAESRVQSVCPRSRKDGHYSRDTSKLQDVKSLSDRIFGVEKGRPGVSNHLVSRRLHGPSPVPMLKPDELGTLWSYPPASKSVVLESEALETDIIESSVPEFEGFRTRDDSGSQKDRRYLSGDDRFSRMWIKPYKKLVFPQDGDYAKARQELEVHKQAATAFVGDRSLEELHEAWLKMPFRSKTRRVAHILLGCLADSARRTLLMLSVLAVVPREWRTRCDCLCYLDMVYRDEIAADQYLRDLFAKQIALVSRIWTWPEETMPFHFLVLLLRHNDAEHCENIIDTLFQNSAPVPPRLILVMVDHFTKLGDAERAIELLSCIPPEQREEHKMRILDRCAKLITIDTVEESGTVGNFRALPKLIELGMPMDAKAHNLIIERAISLEVPDVAWEVFRFMEAKGIHVDERSHLFLLKDSFERQNREKLDEIMSAIHQREDLYKYPYLVTYMMHIVRVVCTIDRKLPAGISVSHLLAIYDRAYDRAPLIKLGIVNPLPVDESLPKRLNEPPPAVLGFTIWAYVLCQRDERLVSALWYWIIHMIKQQDPSIVECAKHDIMYNGFIHFYARSRFFLRKAVDVVEAMIERNLCAPSERTWSEVLCGFLQHGEEEAAEKIWRMMLARDVQPTEKGYAFLLGKYDESQLAKLVRYVLDERRIPDGLDETLKWQDDTNAATKAVEIEALDSQRSLAGREQDAEGDGIFESYGFKDAMGDPALEGANMYQ